MVHLGVKRRLSFTLLSLVLLTFGCTSNTSNKEEDTVTKNTKPAIVAPRVNSDSAFAYVKAQVDFGPRIPNSVAQSKCANWLAEKMKSFSDTVIVQDFRTRGFDGKTLNGKNIISSFNPKMGNRILLCAHWDSRPFADQDSVRKDEPIDGANDGASGVGVLIEVARQLSIAKPQIGVDIIFFDIEDYGQPEDSKFPEMADSYCLGSQYWSKNLHVPNYFARYGILLDMVGGENAKYTQEGTSVRYAPAVVDLVWKAGSEIGYSDYFLFEKTKPIIDDHFYINQLAQIRCVDIIHFDNATPSNFWKHWHTHGDTIDKIDKKSLQVVGQTLMEVLYRELSNS